MVVNKRIQALIFLYYIMKFSWEIDVRLWCLEENNVNCPAAEELGLHGYMDTWISNDYNLLVSLDAF